VTTYAYYPGCSGLGTSMEYERSTRAVFEALGIKLDDIPDWSCCGSTPAHATSHLLSGALSARNLEQARGASADRILTPCPSCLANLRTAHHRLHNETFRGKVNELLDNPCPAPNDPTTPLPNAYSTLQVLVEDFGIEQIAQKVSNNLGGIKVVPYYGCLMSRPVDIMNFDTPENPMAIDNIMTALGAEVLPFSLKTECCGAAMGIPRGDISSRLSGKLLANAHDLQADAIVVACPLCHMNLDLRQQQAARAVGREFNMPVLYFTQLMGLALGLSPKDLGFDKLIVKPDALLEKIEAAREQAAREQATLENTKEASA